MNVQDGYSEVYSAAPSEERQLHLQLKRPQLEELEPKDLHDVRTFIVQIQQRQEAENGLMDSTRLASFIDAMEAVENKQIPDINIALVWSPMWFMLDHTRQDPRAFDPLLVAYQQIGKALPHHEHISKLDRQHHFHKALLTQLLGQVIDFHRLAASLFLQPSWKTLFRPLWKDLEQQLATIEANLKQIATQIGMYVEDVTARSIVPHTHVPDLQPTITNHFHQHTGNIYERVEVSGNAYAHLGDAQVDQQTLDKLIRALKQAQENLHKQEQERRELQVVSVEKWLAGASVDMFQDYASKLRHQGTGSWILRQKNIADWIRHEFPRSPALWMQGIPGAGKTVLASVIINECKQIPDSDTIYFHSRHDHIENTGTPMSILRGLLRQLLHCRPWLAPFLEDTRRTSGEQPELRTFKTAKKAMEPGLRDTRRIYVILDGIDECESDNSMEISGIQNRGEVLSYLANLVEEIEKTSPGTLRLLVVSQNDSDIRQALSSAGEFALSAEHNQHDIKTFVEHKGSLLREKFELSKDLETSVAKHICNLAHGQFLYAGLVVDNLLAQVNREDFYFEIRRPNFPEDLKSAYQRVIARIRKSNNDNEWKAARRLLGWMCRALRPLKRHELQSGTAIHTKNGIIDQDLHLREPIEKLCGALISVVNERITLIHSTAKEYITTSEYVDEFVVDCELTAICLDYLSFDCFSLHMIKEESAFEQTNNHEPKVNNETQRHIEESLKLCILRGDFAFAEYAISKWSQHLRRLAKQIDDLSEADYNSLFELAPTTEKASLDPYNEHQPSSRMLWTSLEVSQSLSNGIGDRARYRADALSEVCHSISSFGKISLPSITEQLDTNQTQAVPSWNERTLDLLVEYDAGESCQIILEHDEAHKQTGSDAKRISSLPRLDHTSWRSCLERLANKKERVYKQNVVVLKAHYGERLFRCSRINCHFFHEGYPTIGARNNHHARHERPFPCRVENCISYEQGFVTQPQLDSHVRTCHPDDDSKRKLFDAIAKHEAEKVSLGGLKYPCNTCDKSFARNSILRDHQRVHAGQKPYECSNCGKAFTRKNDCTRHEKQHTRNR